MNLKKGGIGLSYIKAKIKSLFPHSHVIGNKRIALTRGHMLGVYQSRFKKHETALGEIAAVIHAKYPGMVAIDIGANVGDSAALICKHVDIPVLCIEGDPFYHQLLKRNVARINRFIEIAPFFVGPNGVIEEPRITRRNGTSIIDLANLSNERGGKIRCMTLEDILRIHNNFSASRLIKIDTDGCDFMILDGSLGLIETNKPVIFFEYDISFCETGPQNGLEIILRLVSKNYLSFIIYDNFGNLMARIEDNFVSRFEEINAYLSSCRKFGGGVNYIDICALHLADHDLVPPIIRRTQS